MAAPIALLDRVPVGNLNLPAVKICGFKEPGNLREIAAIDGVHAIGLNFFPKSKRAITPEIAAQWQRDQNIREFGVTVVGVFVNAPLDQICQLHGDGIIDVAQLHGTESPEEVGLLTDAGIPIIKAHGLKSVEDLERIATFPTVYHLIDAFAPGVWGGTGDTVDWQLLASWAKSRCSHHRLVLSGGITPDNVLEASEMVQPSMIDLASSVEVAPGIKSSNHVKTLINNLTSSKLLIY